MDAAVPQAPSTSVHPGHAHVVPNRNLRCIPMPDSLCRWVAQFGATPGDPLERNRLEQISRGSPSWLSGSYTYSGSGPDAPALLSMGMELWRDRLQSVMLCQIDCQGWRSTY